LAFLKKHYEKILLAVFLVIFVIALFYQIDIITTAKEVTTKDLQLEEMTDNYKSQQVDFAAEKFKLDTTFMKESSWTGSTARNKADKYFTDLLLPFTMARCPHCGKIVPSWLILNDPHECPMCHGELKTPDNETAGTVTIDDSQVTATTDSDGGGIPDLEEKKYGLKPELASDDATDLDGDGFANVYEYDNKTKMNDPKSHPPLYLRLKLDKLVKNKLDFTLKNIIIQGANKADWDIQINFGPTKTEFFWLDDTMKVGSRKYKIIEIEAKKIKVKKGNIEEVQTDGQIKIKSADGKEVVTAIKGKDVFSPNPRAIIIDVGNGRKYSMNIGDVIEIGTKETGVSRYKVTDINSIKGKEAVTIVDIKTKKTYIVDEEVKIPRLKNEKTNIMGDSGMEPGMESPDGMPGEMPPEMRAPSRRGNRRRGPKF
jgi:hypothetical protein